LKQTDTKTCFDCKENKPKSEFFKHNQKKDGLRPECKVCTKLSQEPYRLESQRAWRAKNPRATNNTHLKKLFGITLKEYEARLESQNHCCASCGRHKSEFKRALAVDHDHVSGKIRGLLCCYCNTALGLLRDDLETINKAYNYLKQHKEDKNEIAS